MRKPISPSRKIAAYLAFIVAIAVGSASAADQLPTACEECEGFTQFVRDAESIRPLLNGLAGRELAIRVRRQASSPATEAGYAQTERSIANSLRAQGLNAVAAKASGAQVEVEVDTWFYVYTNKFNARRVWLSEFASESATGAGEAKADQPPVDVSRVVGGAIGIFGGLVSPSFGAYMIASGVRNGVYGRGKAPNRALLSDSQRYERGEQEVASRVRIRVADQTASFLVVTGTLGEEVPYKVNALAAQNWALIGRVLTGATPIEASAPELPRLPAVPVNQDQELRGEMGGENAETSSQEPPRVANSMQHAHTAFQAWL